MAVFNAMLKTCQNFIMKNLKSCSGFFNDNLDHVHNQVKPAGKDYLNVKPNRIIGYIHVQLYIHI